MAGLIIFSPTDETIGFATGDELAINTYLDIENDTLYFVDGSRIYQWEGDSAAQQTYVWKSGKISMKNPINLGAAKVEAETYTDLVFKLYANIEGTMTLKHTQTVLDGEPFRLPGGYLSAVYEVELTGTDTVAELTAGENIWDLSDG